MENTTPSAPWWKEMSHYHWFVFVVCSLGWGLDCFDQQVFNLMRMPALADLMGMDTTNPTVTKMGGYATSIMLLGWGFGGILFGIMADKFGRARMMIVTVVFYAGFTGLSGLAMAWMDFFLYRFLCGMGVGGFFAAGVTLLAETMPDKARPKTLGLLQVIAAFCNLCAAALVMFCGILEQMGFFQQFPLWRCMFVVGFIPAVLAFVIMRYLEEPKAWKDVIAAGGAKKAGSLTDLFGHPRWRHNVIIGMCLATCGIIGLWGIGFFSVDLTRTTFRLTKNQEARDNGDVERLDFEFIRMLTYNHEEFLPIFLPIAQEKKIMPQNLIGTDPKVSDPGAIYQLILDNRNSDNETIDKTIHITLEESHAERWNIILDQAPQQMDKETFEQLATEIAERTKVTNGYVTRWAGITSLLFNLGAIFGTLLITYIAERMGRQTAFSMFFMASFFMTVVVFLTMGTGKVLGNPELEVLVMTPLLGFCILSIFGCYAIYFPELFPTRLRSTAISFCYNIARFAAATGPAGLGLLTAYVFHDTDEPIRWAGAAMSVTFILGISFAWHGPETKGQPLPEE